MHGAEIPFSVHLHQTLLVGNGQGIQTAADDDGDNGRDYLPYLARLNAEIGLSLTVKVTVAPLPVL